MAHYVDSTMFGGLEQVVLMLLSKLNRQQWSPVLYCHENTGVSRLVDGARKAGIECRIVPMPTGLGDWRAWAAFRERLVIDRPVAFHAHLGWPLGCRYGIAAAKIARVPYVVATSHLYSPLDGVRFGRIKQWMQATSINRYIAVSNEVEKCLCRDLGVPPAKVRVVHNGIHTDSMLRNSDSRLRTELLAGCERPIVFTAARLHAQKGHDHLLAAAVQIPEALFVLAGDGPDRARLEAKAVQLGIEGRVRFLGQRNDIDALLASCDIFVLPSLYEGLPLSVLEAMAAGRPVVATAVGGTNEAVIDGVCGRLVPPADPASLAAAINALLADRHGAARLAEEGRARVRRLFSIEAMVRGVESVYDEDLAPAP